MRFLTSHTAVDLLTPAHHGRDRRAVYDPVSCVGAYLLEQATGEIVRCFARSTILATGGLGQIYLRTTNPAGSRGDGLAMAISDPADVGRANTSGVHIDLMVGSPELDVDGVTAAGEHVPVLRDGAWLV